MTVPPYLPFDPGPYRLAMGLMALKPADWIEIDADYDHQLAEKRRLLAARHDEVFAALPQADAASSELLGRLASHLVARYPARFSDVGGSIENRATGERWELECPPHHPLDVAGRLVQEDLCLMQDDGDAGYRLTAASLCFPSRWRLGDKIGRPLLDIHQPVPGYAARLGRPVDRFFTLLKSDKPVWRLNWSLYDDPALFQPQGHGRSRPDDRVTAENAGERVYLRVERQTLVRLPDSGAVVFGIRIHQHPLSRLADRPQAAADLAAAIAALPDDMARYKSIPAIRTAVLAYLGGLSGAA